QDHVGLRVQVQPDRRPRPAQLRRRHGRGRRPRPDEHRAPLPPRSPALAVLDGPPLRRPQAREAEPERLPEPARPLPGPRAVRLEGRGRGRPALHRPLQAGRLVALPALAPPCAPPLHRAALRRALRPGHRRRQLLRLRRPRRLDDLEVHRGARAARHHARAALPCEVGRQDRLGLRRRVGEAQGVGGGRRLQAPAVRLRQARHLHRQGGLGGALLGHLRPLGRAVEDLDQRLELQEEGLRRRRRDRIPGRDGLPAFHRHGRPAARACHQGVAAEPALPGRAGLVLQPGREGGDQRRVLHGGGAGERGALSVAAAEELISPGLEWCVRHGFPLTVGESRRIEWPRAYRDATERYSGQVRLGADGVTLRDYVAGLPFPFLDPKDPQVAVKIMWNYDHNFFATDDLDARNFDADTGAIADHGPMTVERHFLIDHFRRLYWVGRLYVDPKPEKVPNPSGYELQQGLYPILEPFDVKGVGFVSYRYLDAAKQDDAWLYLPALRRVRRLSTAQRSDALFGQDTDVDSYGGYAG